MNGLLVIDKPTGITSRDAVNRAARWFAKDVRLGHTGTLDPLATGVLVLCVGQCTRLASLVQDMPKSYTTRLLLGSTSNTDDADGIIEPKPNAVAPTEAAIRERLAEFIGDIVQLPPVYSALKIDGRRAHELARAGESVELAPRTVRVYAIELRGYDWPHLDLAIDCGKGTYIRSIGRELGEKLGCGALVRTLRRERVGPFEASHGVGVDAPPDLRKTLLPPGAATHGLMQAVLAVEQVWKFRQGQAVQVSPRPDVPAGPPQTVAVLSASGEFVGLGQETATGWLRPSVVFAT